MRLLGCHVVLRRKNLGRAGRRDRVGHVEYRRDAAEGGCRGAAREILLVRITGIAEVHVHVDCARQHVHPRSVESLTRMRHRRLVADRDDAAILDGDTRSDDGFRRHDIAAANEEIDRVHARHPHSIAQPPSTGRSTPVIWRAASLARNRQALATSASAVTRLSAYSLA